ncbi:class V aminotransferase [Streptomyces sp. CBMAI 2042]|nr:class V aminotransferase [Streptomyces sp. CBMAI 2042]
MSAFTERSTDRLRVIGAITRRFGRVILPTRSGVNSSSMVFSIRSRSSADVLITTVGAALSPGIRSLYCSGYVGTTAPGT